MVHQLHVWIKIKIKKKKNLVNKNRVQFNFFLHFYDVFG